MYQIDLHVADTNGHTKAVRPVRDKFGIRYFDSPLEAWAAADKLNDRETDPRRFYVAKFIA